MTQPAFVCGYEILAELGRGTTGIVYKARHPVVKPDRVLALKMPLLGSEPEVANRLVRFQNEWNALRVLTWEPDPVIPTLYDVGCDFKGQNDYYVREFVVGSTLEQLVASGAADLRDGIQVLSTIAAAVQRMHRLGIAHRNLRASNVLVTIDGLPKMIGFGHVRPLAGAHGLPPGLSGVVPAVDMLAMQEILVWLCSTLNCPVPAPLEPVRQPDSVPDPGRFAATLDSYLQA